MQSCRLQQVAVEGERIGHIRLAGASFFLATGPARSTATPQVRMEKILQSLAALRAARWCQQVHGVEVMTITQPSDGAACCGDGDGLITAEPGIGVLVWTADCVPLLLAGPGVVAAVHAGWRGAAAGVVLEALRRLEADHGCPPASITAMLGAAVGPCHYPVGTEVIRALASAGIDDRLWCQGDRVDLRRFVQGQLRQIGVSADSIFTAGGCTACDPEAASYRRDGSAAGRQWSMVARIDDVA